LAFLSLHRPSVPRGADRGVFFRGCKTLPSISSTTHVMSRAPFLRNRARAATTLLYVEYSLVLVADREAGPATANAPEWRPVENKSCCRWLDIRAALRWR